jgi:hypothetical protein
MSPARKEIAPEFADTAKAMAHRFYEGRFVVPIAGSAIKRAPA